MFGNSAFAVAPFATLGGGTAFSFSLVENINMADASNQVFAFNEAFTENVVMDDIDATAGSFFGTINEFVAINDAENITAQFAAEIV